MIPEIKPIKASIESCTACNHRCQYCPITEFPKRQQVMTMETFSGIMDEIKRTGRQFERISLSHYNETLLDPNFLERVNIAYRLPFIDYIKIFSNLSLLNDSLVAGLKFAREKILFDINLPTTDRERYKQIHGRDHYPAVERNINALLDAGFKLQINAQKNVFTTEEDALSVERSFGDRAKVNVVLSDDRSGTVSGFNSNRHEGRLVGCSSRRVLDYVHVGVEGEVFLCCQDYFKKYRLGTLQENNLPQILASEQTRKYLSYIYGEAEAPKDFICRSCQFAVFED